MDIDPFVLAWQSRAEFQQAQGGHETYAVDMIVDSFTIVVNAVRKLVRLEQ